MRRNPVAAIPSPHIKRFFESLGATSLSNGEMQDYKGMQIFTFKAKLSPGSDAERVFHYVGGQGKFGWGWYVDGSASVGFVTREAALKSAQDHIEMVVKMHQRTPEEEARANANAFIQMPVLSMYWARERLLSIEEVEEFMARHGLLEQYTASVRFKWKSLPSDFHEWYQDRHKENPLSSGAAIGIGLLSAATLVGAIYFGRH